MAQVCHPNLFVAGTQKAGTTFLCTVLANHPLIFFSKPKELFLFNKTNLVQRMYQEYLEKYFPESKVAHSHLYLAEGSTSYFQSNVATNNMMKFLPAGFKIIVVLRHPVEKALSYFMHMHQRDRFDATRSILDPAIVRTSLYAKHVRRWLNLLGPDRLLVLKYDTLEESPRTFADAATRFLQLPPVAEVPSSRINAGFGMVRREDHVEPRIETPNATHREVPRFSIADLVRLQSMFTDDLRRTQTITGLDLARWFELPDFASDEERGRAAWGSR